MTDPLRLLFVDDDEDIRAIIGMALGLDGALEVRWASGGYEALRMLEDRRWQPECILLDVQMPDVSGDKVLSAIRSVPRAVDLPVILLTANVRSGDIMRYLGLGAIGVIAKPFDPLRLASEVRIMLEQARPVQSH
ncbi:response regulator [Sphingomonas nostoxanthinifaciens]|uniref:response regulator n=1 Tax=Sphingomonas nostoxanthinifaciens TaxID=2872652 RepID=UPI001CC20A99|nr:response regulator [Sphingomonas nostoxanthinifaciens]UAK25129.1 response regulator [Sphingomonas nostoxanthinifaciens]